MSGPQVAVAQGKQLELASRRHLTMIPIALRLTQTPQLLQIVQMRQAIPAQSKRVARRLLMAGVLTNGFHPSCSEVAESVCQTGSWF